MTGGLCGVLPPLILRLFVSSFIHHNLFKPIKHGNINQQELAFNPKTVQSQPNEVQSRPKVTPKSTQNSSISTRSCSKVSMLN